MRHLRKFDIDIRSFFSFKCMYEKDTAKIISHTFPQDLISSATLSPIPVHVHFLV